MEVFNENTILSFKLSFTKINCSSVLVFTSIELKLLSTSFFDFGVVKKSIYILRLNVHQTLIHYLPFYVVEAFVR